MSDLYDSLEDENEDDKLSRDAYTPRKARSSASASGSGADRLVYRGGSQKYSFFLNDDHSRVLLPVFRSCTTFGQERGSLFPEIEDKRENKREVPKIIVDNEILNEQGLQLNEDGSFTKSPRREETLPFITREYRNLQFQKKRTYSLSNTNNSSNENTSGRRLVNHSGKTASKYTFEKESKKPIQSKASKQFNSYHNMANPTKELENGKGNKHIKNVRGQVVIRRRKNDAINPENSPPKDGKTESKGSKRPKKISPKHILLQPSRPNLNYMERRQLEKGFNPLYLRREKKVLADSNRSNFGDSEMGELPEISSRARSYHNLDDESEEIFYKKIMLRDKILKDAHHSSRSEGPIESLKLNRTWQNVTGFNSGRNSTGFKRNSKSMFIDLPTESDHSENSHKKNSHYCSVHTSKNMSKIELALKAKAYGYLVNARNIFRLKAQSERKNDTETETNERGQLNPGMKILPEASSGASRLIKQNSMPDHTFPQIKGKPILARTSASQCKAKDVGREEKVLLLPQVKRTTSKDSKISAKTFERISDCLRTE